MPMATARKTTIPSVTIEMSDRWILPSWPAPANVRCLQTTRHGGVSEGAYTSLNLGDHVGDDAVAVAANRARLGAGLPTQPRWLRQVHGTNVLDVSADESGAGTPEADAALSRRPGQVCGVMTADCLPVLLCDQNGTVVAAVHAGWRGLLAGVVEQTVAAMGCKPEQLLAWLGPAIGPQSFEVGDEVRAAFVSADGEASSAFKTLNVEEDCQTEAEARKWLADIYLLARQRLARLGVQRVYGGDCCTVREADRFFSYRRDGVTGRMATLIWLA